MDEVIGVTNGFGCGSRKKSGTVAFESTVATSRARTQGYSK